MFIPLSTFDRNNLRAWQTQMSPETLVHMPAHTSIRMATNVNTHVSTHVNTHVNTSRHTCLHTSLRAHVHFHVNTHVNTHANSHVNTHVSTHGRHIYRQSRWYTCQHAGCAFSFQVRRPALCKCRSDGNIRGQLRLQVCTMLTSALMCVLACEVTIVVCHECWHVC